eukprot:5081259-Amphidinium_carterae.1
MRLVSEVHADRFHRIGTEVCCIVCVHVPEPRQNLERHICVFCACVEESADGRASPQAPSSPVHQMPSSWPQSFAGVCMCIKET